MRRGMGDSTVTLRHVQTIRKDGRVYRYLRAPGKRRVRLPDLPTDHPDFLAAYIEALGDAAPQARAPLGTISALIEAYLRSERHLALSPDYRRVIRRHADAIREKGGRAKSGDLRGRHIRADLSALSPHAAAARLKAWRLICSFGVEAGLLDADPSEGIKRKRPPKSDGHPAWTREELAAFRDHWPIGAPQRLCFELLQWTGARISDAVQIGPGMVGSDGVLAFRQSKTGSLAYVPWTSDLPAWAAHMEPQRDHLHAALAARSARHMTFLATRQGRPRSHKSLGQLVGKAARQAGVEKSAHGLRKARAVALAEAGATTHQIAAWTGHQTLSEVDHYTLAVNRRRAVLRTEQDRNSVNSLDHTVKFGDF